MARSGAAASVNRTADPEDQVMTVEEVATFLKVSPKTVRRLVSAGNLPSFRVGSAIRLLRRNVLWWASGGKEG